MLSNFIGRVDGISPVNPRFVSKERVKLLSIHSVPVFHYETVTCSSSLVRLQFLVSRWGPGLSRHADRLPPSIPLLSNTEVAAVHNVKRISIRSL